MDSANKATDPNFDFSQFEKNDSIDKVTALDQEAKELQDKSKEEKESKSLFVGKPANEWMKIAKNQSMPNELYGPFWCEGELCILFADTGSGKSLLSVQIADSISKGVHTGHMKMGAKRQEVLYFDFELSPKQFQIRSSQIINNESSNEYVFDENFKRVEIRSGVSLPDNQSYQEFFDSEFESVIDKYKAKIIIIDNLTKIVGTDTDQSKTAKPLMDKLYNLKREKGLSILVIEHTKKTDNSRRISFNDLQGSKMKANLCDSSFAIGKSSKGTSTRYLKQMKYRNGDYQYDSDNVVEYEISKPLNFTEFMFVGYSHEDEHLKIITSEDRENRKLEGYALHQKDISNVEIGRRLNVSEGTVRKWIKSIENEQSN